MFLIFLVPLSKDDDTDRSVSTSGTGSVFIMTDPLLSLKRGLDKSTIKKESKDINKIAKYSTAKAILLKVTFDPTGFTGVRDYFTVLTFTFTLKY